MKRLLATVIVVGLSAFAAYAQEVLAPPPSDAPVVDMASYCERPNLRLDGGYPVRALTRGIEGVVILDCAYNPDETLQSCQIVSENPPRWDFGDAALQTACRSGARFLHPTGDQTYQVYALDGVQHSRFRVRFENDGAPSNYRDDPRSILRPQH